MQLKSTYTLNIFVAYHPSDKAQFEELMTHLGDLDKKNTAYIINKVWYDGSDLSESGRSIITELTEAADIVLILMSENSILSPYFISGELRQTLQQHDKGRSIVVPVILNTCWWEDTAFGSLNVLPRAGLPIFDSDNVKNELFNQVVEELDRKLEKVRLRKEEREDTFKIKYGEADAIFQNWHEQPEKLRAALPLYKESLQLWNEGFSPDYKIIESHIKICKREINFKHYSFAAHKAYKKQDFQTCYFNCKDALDLRDDAVIRKLYKEVKKYLDDEDLQEKKAPFDKYLKQGHAYFLSLQWKKAEQEYILALEHHQKGFQPERKVIEHKIEICKRELTLQESLEEAGRLYGIQNYKKMADVLLEGIQSINHEAFYQIDHVLNLIGYLEHAEPFREEKTNKWGYLNKKENTVIIAPKYTAAYHFSENLAGVKKWDNWGFIDIEGNEIIPFIYSYVSHFQNGIAQVIHNDETFCINHKGEKTEAEIIEVVVPADISEENEKLLKILPIDKLQK
jgi:hypothetical protein